MFAASHGPGTLVLLSAVQPPALRDWVAPGGRRYATTSVHREEDTGLLGFSPSPPLKLLCKDPLPKTRALMTHR